MALKRISLRDYVIVSALDLDLQRGFSVLTGETGAGKSILIDALQLALGARAESAVVREGTARAEISAEFDCPPSLAPWMEESGFNWDDTLLLRRVVDAQGKSRAWINGSSATLTQLREVADHLVDIHGQHAWAMLTRADAVRHLLDAYAGVDTQGVQKLWQAWREAQKALEQARSSQDAIQHERERLLWQIAEMDKLAPGEQEWESLNADHGRLSNAQALLDAAQGSLNALDDDENGALPRITEALELLQKQEHLESIFRGLCEVLASNLAQLEDTRHSLATYLRKTDLDPARLAELDARMVQWMGLARRYKCSPQDVPTTLTRWKQELSRLNAAVDLAALEAAQSAAEAAYTKEAKTLGKARAKAAPALARAITQAMQGLGMQGGSFEVALSQSAQPNAWGLEQVEFLVAGHAGTTTRPVGKVASGGELSRIALAIAVTTSQLGTADTLIFDEVDAGVGGAVAETVGRLMKQLGRDRQVLAVTHLPQVAACADQHLVVAKSAVQGKTLSTVTAVAGEQRVGEVARMLGGERLSGTTLAHARELLGDPQGAA